MGLILNNVGYQDRDRLRSILYEASLSEIFVPYMDPDEHWYSKSYFDGGELCDVFSGAMEPGECPENAVFFDQMYADWKLNPQIKQRAACLFEQPAGVMAWRHEGSGAIETRQARELVLRTIADAGTYDYIFDWIFRQDGTIRVRVGASGEDKAKAVKYRTPADDPTGEASRYGRFFAESYVAVDHDHFFSFRLDFDVDGTANSFVLRENSGSTASAGQPAKECVGSEARNCQDRATSKSAHEYGAAGELAGHQPRGEKLPRLSRRLRAHG